MDTTDWKYFSLCLCWRSFLVALLVCVAAAAASLCSTQCLYVRISLSIYNINEIVEDKSGR